MGGGNGRKDEERKKNVELRVGRCRDNGNTHQFFPGGGTRLAYPRGGTTKKNKWMVVTVLAEVVSLQASRGQMQKENVCLG